MVAGLWFRVIVAIGCSWCLTTTIIVVDFVYLVDYLAELFWMGLMLWLGLKWWMIVTDPWIRVTILLRWCVCFYGGGWLL